MISGFSLEKIIQIGLQKLVISWLVHLKMDFIQVKILS